MKKDKREFIAYLRQCTDSQVQGCYEKEKAAKRQKYANLCRLELAKRNMLP